MPFGFKNTSWRKPILTFDSPPSVPSKKLALQATLQAIPSSSLSPQAQQNELLRELIHQEKITSMGVIESEADLRTMKKIQEARFIGITMLITGLLIYIGGILFMLKLRYRDMIDDYDRVRAQGYPWPSGLYLAFSYEYPGLDVRFKNKNLPSAIVYSYYTQGFGAAMLAGSDTYLPQMFSFAENGAVNYTFEDARAIDIVCNVLGNSIGAQSCQTPCNGPATGGWQEYVTSGLGLGLQGAFLGNVPGFVVGVIAGVGLQYAKDQYNQSKCPSDKRNCIASDTHTC